MKKFFYKKSNIIKKKINFTFLQNSFLFKTELIKL